MFVRFFKNNSPSSYILLPIFALVLWLAGFWGGNSTVIRYGMPLYEILARPLETIPLIAKLTALILVLSEAFLLNYIVNENEILARPSFLPALLYIVFMSSDISMLRLYPILFSNFFILLAIYRLAGSYRENRAFSNSFDAGLLLAAASLFYFPSIIFLPLIGVAFVLFRPFNWREWVISFIGILVPYVFVFIYYFWNDILKYWWDDKMFYPALREQAKSNLAASGHAHYFMLSVVFVIVLFALGKLFKGSSETSQRSRKGTLLLIWFSAFAFISVFLGSELSIRSFAALTIPLSVFCAGYFLNVKKGWWGELLFLLLLISIFIYQFSAH